MRINLLCTVLLFIISLSEALAQASSIHWKKSLGGTFQDETTAIRETADGGYIVAGYTYSNDGDVSGNKGLSDYWIIKLDTSGNVIWKRTYGGTETDRAQDIQQTIEGGYIVAGYTRSNDGDVTGNHGEADYWVLKLDPLGNILWEKTYGGSNDEIPASIIQTTDRGYIVAGYTQSFDGDISSRPASYHTDYWIIKLDSSGNLLWDKALGGSNDDYARGIVQTSDGAYIVAGSSGSNDGDVSFNHDLPDIAPRGDFWVVKLSDIGDMEWEKSYGGSLWDQAACIKQTTDGGYIVAGGSGSNDGDVSHNYGSDDAWVVKIDAMGIMEWEKSFGGSGPDIPRSIQQTVDGGYIIAADTRSNDGDVSFHYGSTLAYDWWIVKLDASGNIQWEKSLGGMGHDHTRAILQTANEGYVVAGYSRSDDGDFTYNLGLSDLWIVKLTGISEPTDTTAPNAIRHSRNQLGKTEIFPNPAKESISFLNVPQGAIIEIVNTLGQTILQYRATSQKENISLSGFINGMYIVNVKYKGHYLSEKIMIQKS